MHRIPFVDRGWCTKPPFRVFTFYLAGLISCCTNYIFRQKPCMASFSDDSAILIESAGWPSTQLYIAGMLGPVFPVQFKRYYLVRMNKIRKTMRKSNRLSRGTLFTSCYRFAMKLTQTFPIPKPLWQHGIFVYLLSFKWHSFFCWYLLQTLYSIFEYQYCLSPVYLLHEHRLPLQ